MKEMWFTELWILFSKNFDLLQIYKINKFLLLKWTIITTNTMKLLKMTILSHSRHPRKTP
jgi:hypothetical protein